MSQSLEGDWSQQTAIKTRSVENIITGCWGFKYFLSVALKLYRTSESTEAEKEKFVAVKLIVCLPWLLQGSVGALDQSEAGDILC